MIATNLTNKNPGGKREKLIDKLPLSTPFVVQIFPIYKCNFKCIYCGVFDKKKKDRFFITSEEKMNWDLYTKCIQDIKKFPEKIKILRFVGVGEPLLHSLIDKMIFYARVNKVVEKTEIITNGSLLSKGMSDRLIISGLDRMVISIQGVCEEDYKNISGLKKFDFDKFVKNIKYFYENKDNSTHLYIKIADVALKSKEDEQKFYDIFGNISDSIGIEHTVDIHTTNVSIKDKNITQFGEQSKEIKICPCPFYMMEIRPDGNVIGCYNFSPPTKYFNINERSLIDIWNNNRFRNRMIQLTKQGMSSCYDCTMSQYRYHPEDDLDDYIEKLKEIYKQEKKDEYIKRCKK